MNSSVNILEYQISSLEYRVMDQISQEYLDDEIPRDDSEKEDYEESKQENSERNREK